MTRSGTEIQVGSGGTARWIEPGWAFRTNPFQEKICSSLCPLAVWSHAVLSRSLRKKRKAFLADHGKLKLMIQRQSLLILLAALTSLVGAEEPLGKALQELNAIRAERKDNLKAIVTLHQQALRGGRGSMQELIEAQLQLLKYQRAGESSATRKLVFQKEIVELETKRHATVREDLKSGRGTDLDFLKSKERLLEARQTLFRFRVRSISRKK